MITLADCTVIRSSRRTSAVEIRNGRVILRLPLRGASPEKVLNHFSLWIEHKLQFIERTVDKFPPVKVEIGGSFPVWNKFYKVVAGVRTGVDEAAGNWLVKAGDADNLAACLRRLYRVYAKELLAEKLHYWGRKTQVEWTGLRISNASQRWGSCNSKGNINLNWRLLLLPEHLADYVIIHELAHRREMNHSKRFYAVLAEFLPAWAEREAELKHYNLKIDNWY